MENKRPKIYKFCHFFTKKTSQKRDTNLHPKNKNCQYPVRDSTNGNTAFQEEAGHKAMKKAGHKAMDMKFSRKLTMTFKKSRIYLTFQELLNVLFRN